MALRALPRAAAADGASRLGDIDPISRPVVYVSAVGASGVILDIAVAVADHDSV